MLMSSLLENSEAHWLFAYTDVMWKLFVES